MTGPVVEAEFAAVFEVVVVHAPVEVELVVVVESHVGHAAGELGDGGFDAPGSVEVEPVEVEGAAGGKFGVAGGSVVEQDGVFGGAAAS